MLLWTQRGQQPRAALWRIALVLVGASLVTHPLAWWANRGLVGVFGFEVRAAIVETAVVIVEGVVLRGGLRLGVLPAFATALVMNAASFGVGLWMITHRG